CAEAANRGDRSAIATGLSRHRCGSGGRHDPALESIFTWLSLVGSTMPPRDPNNIDDETHRGHSAISYSITLSAIASSVGGIVRPSVLAVFRLITSSNLVAWTTGRSAG